MVCDKVVCVCVTASHRSAASATPATRNHAAASPATKRAQARAHARATRASPMPQVPRLATQNQGRCHAPRLPRETKVDVTKCHACHAKYRSVTGDQARPLSSAPAHCWPKTCSKTGSQAKKRRSLRKFGNSSSQPWHSHSIVVCKQRAAKDRRTIRAQEKMQRNSNAATPMQFASARLQKTLVAKKIRYHFHY